MVIFNKKICIKNGAFRKFLKSEFDPNIHQKLTKLHHLKKKPSFATCKFPNLKKKILGPPPPKSWLRP